MSSSEILAIEDCTSQSQVRDQLNTMMAELEDMRDDTRLLEVKAAIAHDGVVMGFVPFLLTLSSVEEHDSGSDLANSNTPKICTGGGSDIGEDRILGNT
ncbi:unnamed protein product [Discosporangium mesarthrocarpum]